jgi:adenosyl cobinamide kinase/adenosyl cobinamide phosphate guanylyltransferase
MPSFIPGNEDVTIHNFGTKMVSNATKAERNHQWEVLRNPESTEEAIAENLSEFRTVLVQNQATMRQNKMDFAEIRIALAEAETEEDKAAAYAMSHALLLKILA